MATSDVFNETFYRAHCARSRRIRAIFFRLRALAQRARKICARERYARVIVGLRFFQNSKNRKLEVLCAVTFGGIVTHSKVFVPFKSQKIMFFYVQNRGFFEPFKKHDFLRFESRNHFQMHRNITKRYGA